MSEQSDAIDRLRQEVIAEVRSLRAELQTGYVTKDAGAAFTKDLRDLEDRLTWVFRTAMTALILPIFVALISYLIYTAVTAAPT